MPLGWAHASLPDTAAADTATKLCPVVTGTPAGQREAIIRSFAIRMIDTRSPWLPPSTSKCVSVSPT